MPHQVARDTVVQIVGLGAIGSNAAYLLSKMGVGTILGHDFDVVAAENIEPQIYTPGDVGQRKAIALSRYMLDETNYRPFQFEWNADTHPEDGAIVIGAVDSMQSRWAIAESLGIMSNWRAYIDGRMGGNAIEVHYVLPDGLQEYLNEQVVGVEPMPIPCSHRSVAYNGMLCASLISRVVAAILNDHPIPRYTGVDLLGWSLDVTL